MLLASLRCYSLHLWWFYFIPSAQFLTGSSPVKNCASSQQRATCQVWQGATIAQMLSRKLRGPFFSWSLSFSTSLSKHSQQKQKIYVRNIHGQYSYTFTFHPSEWYICDVFLISDARASYHQLPFKCCYQDFVSNAGFISTQNQIAELAGFDQKTKNPKIKLLKLKMLNKTSEGLIWTKDQMEKEFLPNRTTLPRRNTQREQAGCAACVWNQNTFLAASAR